MPIFTYKAKRGPGDLVQGEVEAPSRDHAVRRISEMGYFPVQVEPAGAAAAPVIPRPAVAAAPLSSQSPSWGKVPSREVALFTRQLASLFRSQVPILRSLALLKERSGHPKMRRMVEMIFGDVKGGKPLSSAMERFPEVFPPFYRALVRSGEMSGKLEAILDRLADFQGKEEEFRMRVKGALAYPLFLVAVGAATVAVLLTFVLPRLTILFKEMNTALPLPTRILIRVSDFFSKGWPWMLGAVVLVALSVGTQRRIRRRLKGWLDRVRLLMPVVGPLSRGAEMERFSRTLSLLLKSGLPIIQAVEATVSTLDNELLQQQLRPLGKEMMGGLSLSGALKKVPSFPPFVREVILVGEEGARLDEVLEEIANTHALEVDQATKVLTSLIEPVLILVLGLVVGGIVGAMLLPIFELNMAVQ